jgi:hypothetical protein
MVLIEKGLRVRRCRRTASWAREKRMGLGGTRVCVRTCVYARMCVCTHELVEVQ